MIAGSAHRRWRRRALSGLAVALALGGCTAVANSGSGYMTTDPYHYRPCSGNCQAGA